MKRSIIIISAVLVLAISSWSLHSAEPAKEDVSATVIGLMNNLMGAGNSLDAGKTLEPLSKDKDAVFFFDAKPFTRDELVSCIGRIYGTLKSTSIRMDKVQVRVLGPDAAVWIASGKAKSESKAGEKTEEFLTETWVWQKIEGKWQVVHSHESVVTLPAAEKKEKVEKALMAFAADLQKDSPAAETVYGAIEKFLAGNPDILGSAFAFNPGKGNKAALYSFRSGSKFERRSTPDTYDYFSAEWYAKSAKSGKLEWSDPYYDSDGAAVSMVTCSIPVFGKDNELLGVVTADLGL